MDLYVIYSDYHSEGFYFIVNEKVMMEKTTVSEFTPDEPEYKRMDEPYEKAIVELFLSGGNDKHEIFTSPAPEFLVGIIKRKGDVLPYQIN